MRKLLLAGVCATALGLAACGDRDEANNMDATLNDEMNMDMNATDMNMDMNMDMNATDMNMDMNATDNATMDEQVDNTTTNTGY